ncbi:MAG: sulfotransferase [Anaerolineales bacterium]
MKTNPVFIGGLDRSGKTYMRFMLESHSEFIFSKRTNLWPKYYQKYGQLEIQENLDRCLDALAKNKHILALELDYDLVRNEFLAGEKTYERLFEIIHQQYAVKQNKPFWGDQTEFLERYATHIMSAYPNAKFIQMIRDPRDRFHAILEKSVKKHGIGVATSRWLSSAALGKKYQAKYPDQYKVIRYETMVTQPQSTMKEICSFLGVKYEPAMIELKDIPRFMNKGSIDKMPKISPLSTDYIGKFQKYLSFDQIEFIQNLCKEEMTWLDYPLLPTKFKWTERIKYTLLFWPANTLKMIGWQIVKDAQGGR